MFRGMIAILVGLATMEATGSAQAAWKEIPVGYNNMAKAAWTDVPVGYNMLKAAEPATPFPTSPKHSSYTGAGPDPNHGWEIEGHAGGFFSTPSDGGHVAAIPSGTSTAVSSWMFGTGADLANAAAGSVASSKRIIGLGGAVLGPLGTRTSGPAVGARFSRDLTTRFNLEASVDWSTAGIQISRGVVNRIGVTTPSFQDYFSNMLPGATSTAVSSVKSSQGSQLFWTGVVNINLLTKGKNIPYFTVGGGAITNIGADPHAGILGFYAFDNGAAPHAETDLLNLHTHSSRMQGVGVIGIGYKYYATPRSGIRFDVRDHISESSTSSFLDATPNVATLAPADLFITPTTPALQFSNDPTAGASTLSGPALHNVRYWKGGNLVHQVSVSGGVFYRF